MSKAIAAKAVSLYDVHPGVAMVEKWVGDLKSKTGRSLEEWITFAKKEEPQDESMRGQRKNCKSSRQPIPRSISVFP
jgi:hypothetical protein